MNNILLKQLCRDGINLTVILHQVIWSKETVTAENVERGRDEFQDGKDISGALLSHMKR